MVILSKLEQEYLLRTIESGIDLSDLRALFLWTQGPLQALLPHQALLCLQLDGAGAVMRSECLHGAVLDGGALAQLGALGVRLAAAWRAGPGVPALLDPGAPGGQLAGCLAMLRESGFDNVLVHGSAPLESATLFALFGLPFRPGPRHGHFLQLLLPYLHLGLLRAPARTRAAARTELPLRQLSARELAVLACVRAGHSNEEAARHLGISALTVKNHLQRIYRALGVANRTHAVARSLELRLL